MIIVGAHVHRWALADSQGYAFSSRFVSQKTSAGQPPARTYNRAKVTEACRDFSTHVSPEI